MKIGNVGKATGLSVHTIRYYEKQQLIRQPLKDAAGHRHYSDEDIELLNWVTCMKNSGMSLSKIREYSLAFYDSNAVTCLALLEKHMGKLQVQLQTTQHYVEVTAKKMISLKKSLT